MVLDNFIIGKERGDERRGEFAKKTASVGSQKEIAATTKHRGVGEVEVEVVKVVV
jgi:hypothetical protein